MAIWPAFFQLNYFLKEKLVQFFGLFETIIS